MSQKKPLRSTQAVSPFGVGALVDFPGPESLIHAGLDAWWPAISKDGRIREDLRIDNEPALAKSLGVEYFVTPPAWRELGPKLPFLRFPLFHSCPILTCGRMTERPLHERGAPQCEGYAGRSHPKTKMQQVRFVAACRHGHLRDFPWIEWVAADKDTKLTLAQMRTVLGEGGWLRLESTGLTGGQGLKVVLGQAVGGKEAVVAQRSMAGAFGGHPMGEEPTPLLGAGIMCQGENPALGISPGHELCQSCTAPLIVALRGAGNLYFADVASAIYVPSSIPGNLTDELLALFENDKLTRSLLREAGKSGDGHLDADEAREQLRTFAPAARLDDNQLTMFVSAFNDLEPFRQLTTHPLLSERLRMLHQDPSLPLDTGVVQTLLKQFSLGGEPPFGTWRVVQPQLVGRLERWLRGEAGNEDRDGEIDPETLARRHEYEVFSLPSHEAPTRPKSILKLRGAELGRYANVVSQHFEHVGLVDSLRETRVLKGYSRLFAKTQSAAAHSALMARNRPNWLPAALVYGEGIFLRLSAQHLAAWEAENGEVHRRRLETTNRNLQVLAERRQIEFQAVTPRFALVHTLAHLLINQLVFDSGYGSSSLRERLYVSEAKGVEPGMAGILIYTAAGDSEGSMGGLVRLGEPGILERTLSRALERSLWCSSDPVCIESTGQGPDSCNLAACHSCALLPETSCEQQNRLLDRGVVTGTLNHPGSGYFSGFCRPAETKHVRVITNSVDVIEEN